MIMTINVPSDKITQYFSRSLQDLKVAKGTTFYVNSHLH
mgnify:CR=1 FL=1